MKSRLIHLGIASGVCALSLVGYVLWYGKVSSMSVHMADLESQIQEQEIATKNITSANATLARIESDAALITNYFVPETGVVPFIDELEVRGRALGAEVTVLSVSSKGTAGQPGLVLNLMVKGAFDAVMRTVGAIEYAPYAITMSKISLDHEEKKVWRATFELLVGSAPATATTSLDKK